MSVELDDGYGGTLSRKAREGLAREGKQSELASPDCSSIDAIVAYHLIEKARDLLNPKVAIALPTEYECVVCGDRTNRAPKATSIEWIEHVAKWCGEHRHRHSVNDQSSRPANS